MFGESGKNHFEHLLNHLYMSFLHIKKKKEFSNITSLILTSNSPSSTDSDQVSTEGDPSSLEMSKLGVKLYRF